jgi:hypothetical protein
MNRNKPCHSDAECVISDVRDCVAEYRWRGVNTVSALAMIAEHCGVTTRRVRALFYRDQPVLVGVAERERLALRFAALLLHIADELRQRAADCDAKAEAIRIRESQLSLPLGKPKWSRNYTARFAA